MALSRRRTSGEEAVHTLAATLKRAVKPALQSKLRHSQGVMDRWLRYANKPKADDLVRATAKRRTEDFFALLERAVDHSKYDALDRAIRDGGRRE
jgi:hypothetical protein